MKKTIWIGLIAALALLAGCASAQPEPEPTPTPTPEPTATPEPSAAAEMELRVAWNGAEYSGVYTGGLKAMRPDGEGVFEGRSAARERFAWEGGWSAGEPAGPGTLTLDGLLVTIEGEPAAGSYAGEAADGVPEGEGTFVSADAAGTAYTYAGHWSAGRPDGHGTLTYDARDRYIRAGTFTDGTYTPTWKEALLAIGTCEPCFAFTPAQEEFIEQYPSLWEADNHRNFLKSEYKKIYDHSLIIKKIFQKPELLETPKWMGISALRIVRSWTVTLGGQSFTCVTAADSTYTYPLRVIIPEAIDGLRRGQRFHVYGIPLAMSEYTTVLGERRECLVLLAGDVYISRQ